ncbi:MAG: hypothetical protein KA116_05210 [Proteobacteria bacterium]|nr:hypothetical protein [Pseudomonadota bacterium]
MKLKKIPFLFFLVSLSSLNLSAAKLALAANSAQSDPFIRDFQLSLFRPEMTPDEFIETFVSSLSQEAKIINNETEAIEIHGTHKVPLQNAPIEFATYVIILLSQSKDWKTPWGPTLNFTKASFIYPLSQIRLENDSTALTQSLFSLLDENSTNSSRLENKPCQMNLFLSGNSNSFFQLTNN